MNKKLMIILLISLISIVSITLIIFYSLNNKETENITPNKPNELELPSNDKNNVDNNDNNENYIDDIEEIELINEIDFNMETIVVDTDNFSYSLTQPKYWNEWIRIDKNVLIDGFPAVSYYLNELDDPFRGWVFSIVAIPISDWESLNEAGSYRLISKQNDTVFVYFKTGENPYFEKYDGDFYGVYQHILNDFNKVIKSFQLN